VGVTSSVPNHHVPNHQSGRPVVITKHGKPVVKLVPANEGEDEIFGALAGIARIKGDIENTVPASDWGVE
jgi:antitoxin (DNA-binding transcriptional repressor) of toxin-antitoxin stability system